MPNTRRYWLEDPQAPFATFLSVIYNYLNPEAYDLETLQRFVKRSDQPKAVRFNLEFREIIVNPKVLPQHALFEASDYEHGSDEAFLAWLWRELYGDEPPEPS